MDLKAHWQMVNMSWAFSNRCRHKKTHNREGFLHTFPSPGKLGGISGITINGIPFATMADIIDEELSKDGGKRIDSILGITINGIPFATMALFLSSRAFL